jgi:hypothetical protein
VLVTSGLKAAEPERPSESIPLGALHGKLRPLSAGRDASRLDQEGLACLPQLRAVRHAVKQCGAELLFQIPDLLADRG